MKFEWIGKNLPGSPIKEENMSGEKGGYFRRGPDVTGDDIYSYHVHFPEPSICQRCQAVLKKGRRMKK